MKALPDPETNLAQGVHAFSQVCQQQTELSEYPFASEVVENIVVYRGESLTRIVNEAVTSDHQQIAAIKSELARCLKDGPGVFVVRAGYHDLSIVDRCTEAFRQIVAEEAASGIGRGDHFGDNERIWNSLQKVCVADPDLFIDYYSNPILRLVSEAWLGPGYRITAQMNNVLPGGKEQSAHRDYHLGFQPEKKIAAYPLHAQAMSQFLTLQGAVAHTDMPVEAGPTLFLPYSQQYKRGYMAFRRPDFAQYFAEQRVQVPLAKGDMVFFSPAVFHAGGSNSLDHDRVANLLQISSAFGRTMETLDHWAMIQLVYPALLKRMGDGSITECQLDNTIAAVADGYAFPTNLDSDPPIGGSAPQTQQDLLRRAVLEQWPADRLKSELNDYRQRRRT